MDTTQFRNAKLVRACRWGGHLAPLVSSKISQQILVQASFLVCPDFIHIWSFLPQLRPCLYTTGTNGFLIKTLAWGSLQEEALLTLLGGKGPKWTSPSRGMSLYIRVPLITTSGSVILKFFSTLLETVLLSWLYHLFEKPVFWVYSLLSEVEFSESSKSCTGFQFSVLPLPSYIWPWASHSISSHSFLKW